MELIGNTFIDARHSMAFFISFPSARANLYAPTLAAHKTMYGPFQLRLNTPWLGSLVL